MAEGSAIWSDKWTEHLETRSLWQSLGAWVSIHATEWSDDPNTLQNAVWPHGHPLLAHNNSEQPSARLNQIQDPEQRPGGWPCAIVSLYIIQASDDGRMVQLDPADEPKHIWHMAFQIEEHGSWADTAAFRASPVAFCSNRGYDRIWVRWRG